MWIDMKKKPGRIANCNAAQLVANNHQEAKHFEDNISENTNQSALPGYQSGDTLTSIRQ